MKSDIKQISEVKRDIHIYVDKDSLQEIKTKVLDKINREANVPGFRKGKAPLDLIERRFPSLIKEELLKEAVPFYYQKAVEEHKLEVVGLPKIKDAEYSQDALRFVAQVEIKPQIKIEAKVYAQMRLKCPPVVVEGKEITQFISQFKDKVAEMSGKDKGQLDDRSAGAWAGYSSEEEFKKAVEAEIYINKVIQRRRNLETEISQALLSRVKCGLPGVVVEEQKKHLMSQQIMDLRSRGVPEDQIKKHSDEISQKVEALAKEQVKLYYILEEIAKKEKLNYAKNNLYEVVIGFIFSQMRT